MKRSGLLAAFGAVLVLSFSAQAQDLPGYGELLKRYVKAGGVEYGAWKAAPGDLAALKKKVGSLGDETKIPEERSNRFAYYLNAYNILVLDGVLDAYPVSSIKDIAPHFGFFSEKRFTLAGKKISLNELEKELLLAQFQDPRIHFAVNCASVSCPPLQAEPFAGVQLEAQLDRATRDFLQNNPEALTLAADGRAVHISSLFDWYAADFKKAGGPLDFINLYRQPPLPGGIKTGFKEYNWGLNRAP